MWESIHYNGETFYWHNTEEIVVVRISRMLGSSCSTKYFDVNIVRVRMRSVPFQNWQGKYEIMEGQKP